MVVAAGSSSDTFQAAVGITSGFQFVASPRHADGLVVKTNQAYADFLARHPEDADVMRTLPTNPLPASLQINLRDPNDYLEVATFLRADNSVDRVLNIQQTVDQMVSVIGILRTGGLVVLLVVGLIVLFIIMNTIRLAVVSRADEIERRAVGVQRPKPTHPL